jgi:NAD(P)-dependent dehydrogenase (short-subunit alcohol dehydrogenase family)
MNNNPGVIINIASVGGLRAEGSLGVYNLTKAALIHLTRQLAGELGLTRVVGIAPGLVKTDFAQMLVDNYGDSLAKRLPRKRLGEPQDIANLATFLASDAASWITGETYVIDGGAGVGFRRNVIAQFSKQNWATDDQRSKPENCCDKKRHAQVCGVSNLTANKCANAN